jgi:hypothetical protein
VPFESPQETIVFRTHDSPLEKMTFQSLFPSFHLTRKHGPCQLTERGRAPRSGHFTPVSRHEACFSGMIFVFWKPFFPGRRTSLQPACGRDIESERMTHTFCRHESDRTGNVLARPVNVTQPAGSDSSELMEFTEETTAFLFAKAADLNVVDRPPPVISGFEQTER